MTTPAFMTLMDQGLQIHHHIGVGRAQRNANGRQPIAEADRINFMRGWLRRPNHSSTVISRPVVSRTSSHRWISSSTKT
jgi:hypothetical protein